MVKPERRVAKKRRRVEETAAADDDHVEQQYDQLAREPQVRHLMPIKTKKGIIKRRIVVKQDAATEDGEDADSGQETASGEECSEEEQQDAVEREQRRPQTTAALVADRRAKIDAARLHIGLSCRRLLEQPQEKHDLLRPLIEYMSSTEPNAAVTIRKYAMLSLLEVFKDLLPSYELCEHDLTLQKYKKEVLALYRYENALITAYKRYLIKLEACSKQLSKETTQLKGVSLLALRCMCQCLVQFRDFNYAANLVDALVPYLSCREQAARDLVSETICTVFVEDRRAERTLHIVRRLSMLIKSKQFDCRREITDLFLALPIKDVNLDLVKENAIKQKKFLSYKEKLTCMSRKERKRSKKLEALEREMLATKAEENKQTIGKYHTEIITIVFSIYFRILKQMPRSALMASVLAGLAKFAHMINVDFFLDMLESFHLLLAGEVLATNREVLLCVKCVFRVLSGQGEAITLDPQRFYGHCYRALSNISPEEPEQELSVALDTLESMLVRRRKKVSPQRVLAFTKRLALLALNWTHPAAAAALMMVRTLMQTHGCTYRLLDTECVGAGVYRPDLNDPEYCNAGSSQLLELTLLTRSYHETVRELSVHLLNGCPIQGSASLDLKLRTMSPANVMKAYSTREMQFVPAVTPPASLKPLSKRRSRRQVVSTPQWISDTVTEMPSDLGFDFAACVAKKCRKVRKSV